MTLARTHSGIGRGVLGVLIAAAVAACSSPPAQQPAATTAPATAAATGGPAATDAPIADTPSPFDVLPDAVRTAVDKPFTGDLDEMVKRRVIRAGVTFNRTHYFIDAGQERGLTYEALKSFETDLNTDLKTGNFKVHVIMIPMSREQLYSALATGRVDLVAAMVTVRPELENLVAFSEPTRSNVSQVVVTGPGAPAIATADDLAGQDVFIRRASPYFETVTRLNADLQKRGKPAIIIDEAPDALEDDDILEMVNAGLAPITVVDDYLANFWKQLLTGLTVRTDVALRTGGLLAIAFRKESPKLREAGNNWLRKHQKGDAFRNTIERRYLENVKFAKNAAAAGERRKLQDVVDMFKKYGSQYNIDYLLMAAQGYQ
jgi:membrane-bound lytic murein transglycosylase MltF